MPPPLPTPVPLPFPLWSECKEGEQAYRKRAKIGVILIHESGDRRLLKRDSSSYVYGRLFQMNPGIVATIHDDGKTVTRLPVGKEREW